MKVEGYVPHESLYALLQFEAEKSGVPIRYGCQDLRYFKDGVFFPRAEVIAHAGVEDQKFQIELPGQSIKLIGDVFLPDSRIIYSHHQPLGAIQGRYLFLAVDPELLCRLDLDDKARVINQLYGPVFDEALPMIADFIHNYDYGPEAKKYANHKLSAELDRIREMKGDLKNNEYAIEERTSQLKELFRKQAELKEWIEFREHTTETSRRKSFESEYLSLMRLVPGVLEKIAFTEDQLEARTVPIFIHHDGREYEMGEYIITIGFNDGDLKIKSTREGRPDYPHPHVSNHFVPCLGNLSSGVFRLLAEGDYASLMPVLIQFLQSYNSANPYVKIEEFDPDFDPDEEQRGVWDSCYESNEAEDCVNCSDSECPYKDEAESRCYEGSTTSFCISCPLTCRYHDRALSECREEHSPYECVQCDHTSCAYAKVESACFESHMGSECSGCPVEDCSYLEEEDEDDDES